MHSGNLKKGRKFSKFIKIAVHGMKILTERSILRWDFIHNSFQALRKWLLC